MGKKKDDSFFIGLDHEARSKRLISRALRNGDISIPRSCPVCLLRHRPRELVAEVVEVAPFKVRWICRTCKAKVEEVERGRPEDMPQYAAFIHRRRKDLDLSQAGLAEKAGLTNITISRVESGSASPTRRTLSKIALALGIEPVALLR